MRQQQPAHPCAAGSGWALTHVKGRRQPSGRPRQGAGSRLGPTVSWVTVVAVSLHAASAEQLMKLDTALVVTQVPRQVEGPAGSWTPGQLVRADWFDGARLVVLQPGQTVRVLSDGFASACDPNVSFDGQRVLFAGKKQPGSRWRVWEIGVDGQGLRAVSPEHLDARSPIYVSTLFTLDSPEPWFTTVFVAREQTLTERGTVGGSSLYNVKLDGTELRRLTFNPNHNLDPFQMWDGRLIYAAERYPHEPGGQGGRVSLFAIHIEGADMELYGGELGQRVQQMPCGTEGGLVVFVESDQGRWDGAGQLACVEERRPHVTYRSLTKDPAYLFLHPTPWRSNQLLVARRRADGSDTWGLVWFDADTARCQPVFDTPEFHEVQAVPLRPRARPDGHSTVVTTTNDYGTFYGLNCYTADPMRQAHLKPAEVKRVRFIEGVLSSNRASTGVPGSGWPFVPRRLIGEAPVEADGSFNVEVPADAPILLQTLDAHGLALGTCGWIWVKPKETRGCIGCHEDPELIPENEYVLALRRPSNRLVLPPAQRRSLSFQHEIAPLLKKHCATADCHGGQATPLHLPLAAENPSEAQLQAAYATLMTPLGDRAAAGLPAPGKYVDPGRARTSWLVWQLLGTNTARPWDPPAGSAAGTARKIKQMPPPGKAATLRPEELRTIIQWIDLGAQYRPVAPGGAAEPKLAETK
jgi:hypothetical protein